MPSSPPGRTWTTPMGSASSDRPVAAAPAHGLAILGMLLALGGGGNAVWACSCASTGAQALIDESDLAFVGRAVTDGVYDVGEAESGRSRLPARRVTIFAVERTLKGSAGAERIAVLHRTGSAACGIVFAPDERYLLTSGRGREAGPGPFRVGLCGVRRLSAPLGRRGSRRSRRFRRNPTTIPRPRRKT